MYSVLSQDIIRINTYTSYFFTVYIQIADLPCCQSSDYSLIFDTQIIKWHVDTLSITIGINLWFALQISEHCPYRIPGRLIVGSIQAVTSAIQREICSITK